jgi:cation diffusion facilitator family transporter
MHPCTRDHSSSGHEVDVNMQAVFLHFLGDCFSSLCVLGAGLLMQRGHGPWVKYADPVASLLISLVILATTVPMVRYCHDIVMMAAPARLRFDDAVRALEALPSVVAVRDLHIWELRPAHIVVSARLLCAAPEACLPAVRGAAAALRALGAAESCVQPEVAEPPPPQPQQQQRQQRQQQQ